MSQWAPRVVQRGIALVPAILIVLNNRGYGTERLLHAGDWEFNEIHCWNYHKLPDVLGGGRGYEIHTEGDFDQALSAAWVDKRGPSILNVHLDPADRSRALDRMTARMSQTVVQK